MHSMTKKCERRQKEEKSSKFFIGLESFKDESFKEGMRQ